MINKPPPLNGDNNGDPNIKALTRKRFINHESTLGVRVELPWGYKSLLCFGHCHHRDLQHLEPVVLNMPMFASSLVCQARDSLADPLKCPTLKSTQNNSRFL